MSLKDPTGFLEDVLTTIKVPCVQFYEIDYLHKITDTWIELDCFNLDERLAIDPHDDLELPWAVIYGSKRNRSQIEGIYVKIEGGDGKYLYTADTLEVAIDIVKEIRAKFTVFLKKHGV